MFSIWYLELGRYKVIVLVTVVENVSGEMKSVLVLRVQGSAEM